MTALTSIKKTARIALVALAVSGTALAAAPAQARDTVTFGFNFSTGNGISFSIDSNGGVRHAHGRRGIRPAVCLTNPQIRRGLRDYGFQDIRFYGERRGLVRASAEKGRWDYDLRINRCSGNIDVVDRTPQRFGRPGHHGGGHFRFR